MKKRILLLYFLIGIQAIAVLAILCLALLFSITNFEAGFGRGLQDSFCEMLGIESINQYGAEQFGYVVGTVLFPALFVSLAIWGIFRRRRFLVTTALIFLLLTSAGKPAIVLLNLISLILLFLPRSQKIWGNTSDIHQAE